MPQGQVMHGQIGSPLESCKYDAQPNGGVGAETGGADNGPFGSHKQSGSPIQIVTGRQVAASPMQGELSTPMDGTTSIGVSGSSGTGPSDSAQISSPWTGPYPAK